MIQKFQAQNVDAKSISQSTPKLTPKPTHAHVKEEPSLMFCESEENDTLEDVLTQTQHIVRTTVKVFRSYIPLSRI